MNSSSYAVTETLESQRLYIEPITNDLLQETAQYLAAWHSNDAEADEERAFRKVEPQQIEKLLVWRLVQNPAKRPETKLGYCIRTEDGGFVGTILQFPSNFLVGERRLTGLCSSCFFVRPEARLQALIIFRKYLSEPGYDFYFGTTCSSYSGKLWQKLRGSTVLNSQFEFILPFRTAPLIEALADSKRLHRNWGTLARIIGHGTDTLRTVVVKPRLRLRIEKTQDWERIAEISRRNQVREILSNERSAQFLEWRYGRSPAAPRHQVYCFRDRAGNEGWFALGQTRRGRRGQIRGTVMLDFVWPRNKIRVRDIVAAAIEHTAPNSDALFLAPRPDVQYEDVRQMKIRRKLQSPQCFVLASDGTGTIPTRIIDFVPGDGDSAN